MIDQVPGHLAKIRQALVNKRLVDEEPAVHRLNPLYQEEHPGHIGQRRRDQAEAHPEVGPAQSGKRNAGDAHSTGRAVRRPRVSLSLTIA